MTYAEFFYEIKNKFMGADLSDITEHLAFQFNIEDEEAGGIFYVEVKDGVLSVEPYEYFDRGRKRRWMHAETSEKLEQLLIMLRDKGEKETFSYIKNVVCAEGKKDKTHWK